MLRTLGLGAVSGPIPAGIKPCPLHFPARMGYIPTGRCPMDWSKSEDVESRPGVVSGAFVVKGTRVPADAVIDNAEDGFTAEEIVTEIYEGLPLDRVRRIIEFAKQHAPHPA
jgi:uncharacterized protein (DUF433 family)